MKMEMVKTERWNPIKHDIKNQVPRKVTYHPYVWNYGYFPQTWEDPEVKHPHTGCFGDGDPLDVLDVGKFSPRRGTVIPVKVIGCIGLIDEGETDWKIIAINVDDPRANEINNPNDLEIHKKGSIFSIKDFFVNYKTVEGKPKNVLAYNGEVKGPEFALQVIWETNEQYKQLFVNPERVAKYHYAHERNGARE
eukprot:TRINITY_DN2143_c0_g1_i6.p1 TRINITY_DN2143_c0_g1~~TRINITY_DN2143_c0_g1_i6.p1  ORF type:complete len:193 (+),score=45.54 TRINITY_DN2143_c0_g1_i6:383-961(+)